MRRYTPYNYGDNPIRNADIDSNDEYLVATGGVMDMLSEQQCTYEKEWINIVFGDVVL